MLQESPVEVVDLERGIQIQEADQETRSLYLPILAALGGNYLSDRSSSGYLEINPKFAHESCCSVTRLPQKLYYPSCAGPYIML